MWIHGEQNLVTIILFPVFKIEEGNSVTVWIAVRHINLFYLIHVNFGAHIDLIN